MKIAPDSNVLIRALMNDDPLQSPVAQRRLREATCIAISLPTFCEIVWLLRSYFRRPNRDIAAVIRDLIGNDIVSVDRAAVAAGLACLEAGSDFADGVIAFEGRRLGGEIFMTFDRKAAREIAAMGPVELLQPAR